MASFWGGQYDEFRGILTACAGFLFVSLGFIPPRLHQLPNADRVQH